jgi:hypothetical protein
VLPPASRAASIGACAVLLPPAAARGATRPPMLQGAGAYANCYHSGQQCFPSAIVAAPVTGGGRDRFCVTLLS